jgi:N-acetylneuraminate synthase/sialic acid synthase
LTIDGTQISDDADCYVIAEIGHNHQGTLEQAKRLFAEAKACGADAVKIQKRDNRSLYTREFFDKPYENENSFGPTYGLHREALELGRAEYQELRDYAQEIGIAFFATAFDRPSADFLADLDMPAYKIASGDLTNTPLISHVASIGKPMILSTGGARLEDVERAFEVAVDVNPQVAVLQCTAGYPAVWDELNLRVIGTYRDAFPDAVVGLSSHDNGIAMAVAAFALGARIVEKHFTLDRSMRGTDHSFSLEPQGLRKMVRDLRRLRAALGDGDKCRYPSEIAPLEKMSKKLVAARDLPAGHELEPDDLAFRSPGDGLPPYEMDRVLARPLLQPLSRDQELTFEVLGGAQEPATPSSGHGD